MTATVVVTCPECQAKLKGPAGLEGKRVRCKGCGHSFVAHVNGHSSSSTVPGSAKANGKPAAPSSKRVPGNKPKSSPAKSAAAAPAKTEEAPRKEESAPPGGENQSLIAKHLNAPKEGGGGYGLASDDEVNKIIEEAKQGGTKDAHLAKTGSADPAKNVNPYGLTDMQIVPRCPHCAKELPSENAVICIHCGYNLQTRSHIETKRVYHITPAEVQLWRLPGYVAAVGAGLGALLLLLHWAAVPFLAGSDDDTWWAFLNGTGCKVWGTVVYGFLMYFGGSLGYDRLVLHPDPPEEVKK